MQLSRVAGRLVRLAAALIVTVVAVAGLPRPALAAEPYVGLYSYLDAQAITFRPEFRNQGDSTADMVVVPLNGDVFAETTDRFSNCHHGPPSSYPAAVCVFNRKARQASAVFVTG